MEPEGRDFTLLLEFEGSKTSLRLPNTFQPPDNLLGILEERLLHRIGVNINLALSYDSSRFETKDGVFLLQRYSKEWCDFVDVLDIIEIDDGDHLKVVPLPVVNKSESKDAVADAQNHLNGVKTPVDSHAKVLKKVFSGSKFNPSAECVATSAHSKKKKFCSSSVKPKDSSVTVIMLPKYQSQIPRGEAREKLTRDNRVQIISLNRQMTPKEVVTKIQGAFKCKEFTILECAKGGYLLKSGDTVLTGQLAIDRRGALYLCENTSVPVDGVSSPEVECKVEAKESSILSKATSSRKRKRESKLLPLSQEELSICGYSSESEVWEAIDKPSSSTASKIKKKQLGSDRQEPLVVPSSSSSENEMTSTSSDSVLEYLAESRRIRLEQDKAFEESLRIDRLKDEKQRDREELEELKELCEKKFSDFASPSSSTLRVPVILPGSRRIECTLPENSPAMRLYQYVLAKMTYCCPFVLVTRLGHNVVDITNCTIPSLVRSSVLVVEEMEDTKKFLQTFVRPDDEVGGGTGNFELPIVVSTQRREFISSLKCEEGSPHLIRRSHIYDDALKLYSDFSRLVNEYPFHVVFENEEAIDTGGVARDFFSGFWKEAYKKFFDGSGTLVPASHPGLNMSALPLLGTILSHGYIVCGFLPVYISFSVLAAILLGPNVNLEDSLLSEFFIKFLSLYDASILKDAFMELSENNFSPKLRSGLFSLFSCFNAREAPSPGNLKRLVNTVARHEFLIKPLGSIYAMHGGVPAEHKQFWQGLTVDSLVEVYQQCTPTTASVLSVIVEPILEDAGQAAAYNYLLQYVGNMKQGELSNFLRFVTGSSALIVDSIEVGFNGTSGFGRAPKSHTCTSILELPTTYATYLDFRQEFDAILSDENSWIMNFV